MKVCTKCGIAKDESEFGKRSDRKSGLTSRCKECMRKYEHEYRAKHPHKAKEYREKNADKLSDYRKKSYKEYQEFLNTIKLPCAKCGETRPWVIQFHHVNPENKSFEISTKHSKRSVLEEVKKCVCLCSNCHDEFHWFYGKNPEEPFEALLEYLGRVPSYV